MSNKACKVKICICAAVGETNGLIENFKAHQASLADLQPTPAQLDAAGIDKVIEAADAAVAALRELNARLVKFGVNLSS